jgi:hypothetical protein
MRWTRQRRARRVRRAGHSVSDHRARKTTALIRLRESFDGTGTKPVERFLLKVSRTAKACGPGTRCWCQVGEGLSQARPGAQDRQFAGDGGKTNSSPGRARHKPLKPFACGNAGRFRCLRCEHPCATFTTQRVRGCGCTGRPAFPTPSVSEKGEKVAANPGRAAPRGARTRLSGGLLEMRCKCSTVTHGDDLPGKGC